MGRRKELTTRLQYVLKILVEYKRTGKIYNLATAPDGTNYGWEPVGEGWLPIYALEGPYIGGSSGDRRKRELQTDFGIPIEKKVHHWISDPKKYTFVYRLGCDPEEIDIKNIAYRPRKVEQLKLV